MKIIKEGRPQKGWAKEFICTGAGNSNGGCGATLLVEVEDLFQTQRNCMHETDYFVTFECAGCGVLTDINSSPKRATELPHYSDWKKINRRTSL